jgi:hypothetical protein
MSCDLEEEDIVTVIDGREELAGKVRHARAELQKYLSQEFGGFMIESQLPGSAARAPDA